MSRNFEILERSFRDVPAAGAMDSRPIPVRRAQSLPDAHTLSRGELLKLVQRVFLLNQTGKRAVVFTAIQSGTGCTSICAGAGEAIAAQVQGPVCLVDANLRRPTLHLCFGVENRKGLTDSVFNPGPVKDFVQKVPGSNLWLLPCGSMTSHLSAVMKTEHLESRLNELRKEFAYVLIDSPAVGEHGDAILLGKLTDGVVLILESHATRREVARTAKESFNAAHVQVLGAVLNKRTFPIPRFLYERL